MAAAPGLTDGELTAAARLPLRPLAVVDPHLAQWVRDLMWERAGILRDGSGLSAAAAELRTACNRLSRAPHGHPDEVETAAMVQAARLVVEAALLRTESRGGHYRTDFPAEDEHWRRHIVLTRGQGGDIIATYAPVLG